MTEIEGPEAVAATVSSGGVLLLGASRWSVDGSNESRKPLNKTDCRTSRNAQRQKEQLEAFSQPPLTEDEVENIAEAGKGKLHRSFMKEVWDKARE